MFDDPEDDEFDGELEEDDEDHPKVLISFAITEVQYGPAGEVVQTSIKTAQEIDQSSMISPPRDIDMTSQVASSEGGATTAMLGGKTQSVVQMGSGSTIVNEVEHQQHSEFRKYSTTTTTHQVTTTTTGAQHHQMAVESQSRITEAGAMEEGGDHSNVDYQHQ